MFEDNILELKNIVKIYPGVRALDDISIKFRRGEIHALAGENGAGKSTFIKIITGAIQPTSGNIIFEGKRYSSMTPQASRQMGIAAIYQEFTLFNYLSVAENIFFGREPTKGGFVNFSQMHSNTKKIFERIGIRVDPKKLVYQLGIAYQQIVEIAKAISQDIKVLIMDEPSAPLTLKEISSLFDIVATLKKQGVTIIYISHRLEEIFSICDRVTILRDGQYVETKDVGRTNRKELITLMVGRELKESFLYSDSGRGEVILRVEGLVNHKLKNVTFELRKGEILGIGGLVGAGRSELARAIFGADKIDKGIIKIRQKSVRIKNPLDAIKNGISLIPEDRKKQGLLMGLSVMENITFSSLNTHSKFCFLNTRSEKAVSLKLKNDLDIKTPHLKQLVKNLSGGNQQKVVLAKTLATKSEILIFDEPTRGIDVGAKGEIYQIMRDIVAVGKSIIMISSEMPELLGISDRILVMRHGRLVGELKKEEYSQEAVLELASIDIANEQGV